MYGGDCLMGELTLLDVVYMYKWTEDAPLRLMYTVSVLPQSRKRAKADGNRAVVKTESGAPPCKVAKLQLSSPDSKVTPPVGSAPWQDSKIGDIVARDNCKDEKQHDSGKVLPPQTFVADKPNIATSTMSISASLCTETKPSSSVTQTSIMSCGTGAVQLTSARGRPALTTTTSATATPRVALAHMSSPQTPPTTVPLSVVGPNALAAVASSFNTKGGFNPVMTSAPAVMIQTSQPVVNGLNDCGLKQVRGTGPNLHVNKMPQPIIPTRPRLGRPPNPARMNAVKMRPPAPRMSVSNVDVRARPPGKKMYPGVMASRPSGVVSPSLNVQNRLSSISGPPAKPVASKVSVKRSSDGLLQDGVKSPLQNQPVSSINSSTSSISITTPCTSSITLSNTTHGPPTTQPPSPSLSQVFTSKDSTNIESTVAPTKTTSSPHQGTLAMDKQTQKQCLPQTQGAPGGQRTNQVSPRPSLNPSLRPPAPQVPRHPGTQMGQRQPPSQSSQRTPTPSSQQRQPTQANQRPAIPQNSQGNQQPSNPQVMQHPISQENSQLSPGLPGTGSPAGYSVQKLPLSSTTQRLSNLGVQRPHLTPAPQRQATRPSSSPAPHRPPNNHAHRHPNSPALHRPPNSPAHHRQPGSPAPHRPPGSPAPHRQAGSTTPRPHSTPTPPSSIASPSPRSTPSPRCASSPFTAAVSAPGVVRDALSPLTISSPVSSVAQSSGTNTANGTTQGSKSSEPNNHNRVTTTSGNGITQTPPVKTVSPGGGKTAPKSPGRGRGASSSPSILSIAQSLANRHLQQRTTTTTTVSPSNNSALNSISIGTSQMNPHQAYTTATTTPVYPGPVASSFVPLAAAAYMASTYGDTTPDVTAMRNLITLSQAACIREQLNAMVSNFPRPNDPRPNDPAPIDLSPTSKVAPQTPLTNGRLVVSSSSTTATKTTNSKSPTKTCRPSTTANAPTISPPTPEVTITKLPNTTTTINTPTSSTTKTTYGSAKLGSSNTNTVSITKRPASSKIAITKSPANASVRQIPNPSFLRHQSEARNNNNVSKPPSSSGSHTVSATTASNTKNVSNKQSGGGGGGGRATGNSPLKETGPLPKTSSILEIENLTKSLPAPAAAAAAASHGFNFFDNR